MAVIKIDNKVGFQLKNCPHIRPQARAQIRVDIGNVIVSGAAEVVIAIVIKFIEGMKAIIHHQPEIKIIPGHDGAAPYRPSEEMHTGEQGGNERSTPSKTTAAGIY
jgi:hypothetical protein